MRSSLPRVVSALRHRAAPLDPVGQLRTLCSAAQAVDSRKNDIHATDTASGPGLHHFIQQAAAQGAQKARHAEAQGIEPLHVVDAAHDAALRQHPGASSSPRKVYIETYGCQMNVNDSEVVLSVLGAAGYTLTQQLETADVVLVNTCAIRDNAEQRVWSRLGLFKNMKRTRRQQGRGVGPVVGVLGCMAERLKSRLLESDKLVDVVVGPDAYRDLPRLIDAVQGDALPGASRRTAINVQLSLEETYADITPLRPSGATSAYLSIMRGCNNLCAFCIVPFTRGRERSRPAASILDEVRGLADAGVREVTLLGQNVNSYADFSEAGGAAPRRAARSGDDGAFDAYAQGFRSVYVPVREGALEFAELLDRVARVDPEMRVRFTSPHPKDFSDDVLQVIASHPNVCKQLHMPAQSGSSSMLARMARGYSREAYDALTSHVRQLLPAVALSTDIIVGYCGETEAEHAATVELLRSTGYDQAFLFAYSQREKTAAARRLVDDVPPDVKSARLQEVIGVFREELKARNAREVGRRHIVLVEGPSKRAASALTGRTCSMKRVVFEAQPVPASYAGSQLSLAPGSEPLVELRPGDYVAVEVTGCSTGTLFARPLARTGIEEFVGVHGSTLPQEVFAATDLSGGQGMAVAYTGM